STTNFTKAFSTVSTPQIIPYGSHTSIIFLTDGDDNDKNYAADALLKPFRDTKFLRVIPIGILSEENDLLNRLAVLGKAGERAIYITGSQSTEYQNAFDTAFKMAFEQSNQSAHLEINIQARDQSNSNSALIITRSTLAPVCYDGFAVYKTLYFAPQLPIYHLKFRFECEGNILQGEHRLTDKDRQTLEKKKPLTLSVHSFEWKNNTIYSWLIVMSNIAAGVLILTSTAWFLLSFPQVSLAIWQPLVMATVMALAGSILLILGMWAAIRKTLCLPTKAAVSLNKQDHGLEDQPPMIQSTSSLRFFSHIVAGAALAGSGVTTGHYLGTLAFASKMVMATGISPLLFITGCATTGAIALPILIYGCVQLGMQPITESNTFSIC
ncbi:MAG TPA: hypothetical protein VHD33_05400, partial [Legionellaceae bacterium]|nr:hypothetical protein [Legionellaceae bacterium]